MMRKTRTTTWIGIVALTCCGSDAPAQRKGDAPPKPAPQIGRPAEDFVAIHRGLGSPKVAISVEGLGRVSEGERVAFEKRLGERFQDSSGRVQIIHPQITELRSNRKFKNLVANNDRGAAKLLTDRVQAGLGIVVVLDGRNPGSYWANYTVYDAKRGVNLGGWSWQIYTTPLEPHDIDIQVRAVAAKLMDHMERFAGAEKQYELMVVGLDPKHDRAFRQALRDIDGVQFDITHDQVQGNASNLTVFRLRFSGGDALDLREEARANLEDLLFDPNKNIRVKSYETENGGITLKVIDEPPPSILSGDPPPATQPASAQAALDRMHKAYIKAGRPKIAVLINEPRPLNARAAQADQNVVITGQHVVVDADATAVAGTLIGSDVELASYHKLMTIEVEDRIVRRINTVLGSAGVRCINLRNAYEQSLKASDKQERILDQLELALQLAAKDNADVVIRGLGRTIAVGSKFETRFTFEAFQVKDSVILGTAPASASVDSNAVSNNAILDAANETVSRDTVGKLLPQMRDRWEPPGIIALEVTNVASSRAAVAIADGLATSLSEHIAEVIDGPFEAGTDGGLARFSLVLRSDYSTLLRAIQGLSTPDAAFTFEGESTNRQGIRLRASGG